jgi:hypothetical protein
LLDVGDAAWLRSSTLTSGWWGPAKEAFVTEVGGFFHALDEATGLMREYAGALDGLADGIEQARNEYHQRMAAAAVVS